MEFIEVSAKTGSSVSLIFEKLATGIFKTKEEKKKKMIKMMFQKHKVLNYIVIYLIIILKMKVR